MHLLNLASNLTAPRERIRSEKYSSRDSCLANTSMIWHMPCGLWYPTTWFESQIHNTFGLQWHRDLLGQGTQIWQYSLPSSSTNINRLSIVPPFYASCHCVWSVLSVFSHFRELNASNSPQDIGHWLIIYSTVKMISTIHTQITYIRDKFLMPWSDPPKNLPSCHLSDHMGKLCFKKAVKS